MLLRNKSAFLSAILAMVLLLSGFLPWEASPTTLASTEGLLNPGFEEGLLNWTVVQPVPDAVVVVGSEGPDDFATYAYMGITVSPFRGDYMLRLGTPKRIAESQKRGENTVYQTFTADRDSLRFAFRLFSWEHRGNDVFRFDLKDENEPGSVFDVSTPDGSPLTITMPDGSQLSCSTTPCQFVMDVGSRGQFLDSGWVEVKITGITVGHQLTLTYSVGGTKNEAHGTWAYFDNVNTPPVAKFIFSPIGPFEGDVIEFADLSYDPDPGDAIVAWHWDIEEMFFNAQNPFFVPPDEGTYNVSLTVTDTYGDSNTVHSGGIATDGDPVPAVVVENAPPLVNALNIEVLPGEEATLVGRFLDPGWLDTHSATWSLDGWSPTATLEEDNLPFIDTGVLTGEITIAEPPGQILMGNLTVVDSDGAPASDIFQVIVVADDPNRREPDNTLANATALRSGAIYLSYLQSVGDIDLFEVVLPNGQPLPLGTELLVTLKDLPADYDLVILSQLPEDVETAPFQRSPFQRSPFEASPFQRSPFQRSPFQRSPFQRSPFQRSPFQRSPFQRSALLFDRYPLSQIGFSGLDGEKIGGTDIALAELGLGGIDGENLNVVGFSANRGFKDEALLVRSEFVGTRLFVAVLGANGIFSTQPYALQVETSQPLDLLELLGSDIEGSPLVGEGQSTNTTILLYDDPEAQTLFVTQRERLRVLYELDDAAWDAFETDLIELAQHPAIRGDIISLPSIIYDDWDRTPYSVDAANNVAAQIRTIIQDEINSNPGIQYVVLLGSDDIIPYRRVPDETIISNERYYLMSSFLKPGSPLFSSMMEGFNLSDDYYVDLQPIPWQGRSLYIPDVAVARLVETPEEISAAATTFLASNGTLDPATALVTGYDFFSDGAQAVADTLEAASLTTDTLINDWWSSSDLRSHLLGEAPDISAINAHFAHYAALSALGFTMNDPTDFLSSEEVASAGGASPILENGVVFSMGCHAGLSVPDRATWAVDPGLGINPALDFVQAMAIQRAIYVASTGYGLGDDVDIGGTERLIGIFTEELLEDDITVGQALVAAKQHYLSSLSAMTVYDEKSSIQFTLYGLPQYQVQLLSGFTAQSLQTQATGTNFDLTLTVVDGQDSSTTSYGLQEVTTGSGTYYTADGDAQATVDRAVQPRVVLDIPSASLEPVHGVLLTGGEFTDLADFDPVITRPTREGELEVAELPICLPSFWPSELATVNNLETSGGLIQTLVVIPGQFRCTSALGEPVVGIQRLYTDLTFELLRSPLEDYEPPTISSIDLRTVSDTTMVVTIEASDRSGIAYIVVLTINSGMVTATSLDLEDTPQSGQFTIDVPVVTAEEKLVIQVVDGAGNVATATGKGANLSAIRVGAGPDRGYASGIPVKFEATVSGFDRLTLPVWFIWNFGDGTYLSGLLAPPELQTVPVLVDSDGDATFTVYHVYPGDAPVELRATLRVLDANGGIGVDDVILQRWWDPEGDAISPDADLIEGYITNDATTVTVGLRVDGVISDEFQYRVKLDLESGGMHHLRYDGGKVTGLPGLQANVVGNELQLIFDLADIGLNSGDRINWWVETQVGAPAQPKTGFVDEMPDSGFFSYIVQ